MHYLLSCLSVFFQLLPRKFALLLGQTLGILIYYLYPLRKTIALNNLTIAFPDYDHNKRKSILKRCYKHYGMVFIDFFRLPKIKQQKKDCLIVNIPKNNLEFMKVNPGGIIMSAHIGNWEYIGPTLSYHKIKSAGVAAIQKNSTSNEFFNKLRISKYMKVLPVNCGGKTMIQHILDGYYLGLISDQNASSRGTNALFFNQAVSVPKGAAAFHLKTNTPILLGFCILRNDLVYELSFEKMNLENLPPDSNDAIMEINNRFTKLLEKIITDHPEQYFWFHRKWDKQIYKGLSKY